jgi:hypothetical protein
MVLASSTGISTTRWDASIAGFTTEHVTMPCVEDAGTG